jgi:hypothetical protein
VQSYWSDGETTRHNFGRGPSNDYFIKGWFQLSNWFQTRRFVWEFPIGSYVKLSLGVGAILVEGPNRRTHFWKKTIQWLFHQNLFLLIKWFQTRRFLWEFPIGSYVKLSSAVGAILVEGPNRRIHFWKKTMQWLFHQSLVLIELLVPDKMVFMWISHRVLC